ncbi:hypothetical protein HDU76_005991 [Blyttiomyces sp. JEL0837]|nr:hypothetical protein HDU76_005991 [Blyttiomyces sp. JEL0837]
MAIHHFFAIVIFIGVIVEPNASSVACFAPFWAHALFWAAGADGMFLLFFYNAMMLGSGMVTLHTNLILGKHHRPVSNFQPISAIFISSTNYFTYCHSYKGDQCLPVLDIFKGFRYSAALERTLHSFFFACLCVVITRYIAKWNLERMYGGGGRDVKFTALDGYDDEEDGQDDLEGGMGRKEVNLEGEVVDPNDPFGDYGSGTRLSGGGFAGRNSSSVEPGGEARVNVKGKGDVIRMVAIGANVKTPHVAIGVDKIDGDDELQPQLELSPSSVVSSRYLNGNGASSSSSSMSTAAASTTALTISTPSSDRSSIGSASTFVNSTIGSPLSISSHASGTVKLGALSPVKASGAGFGGMLDKLTVVKGGSSSGSSSSGGGVVSPTTGVFSVLGGILLGRKSGDANRSVGVDEEAKSE